MTSYIDIINFDWQSVEIGIWHNGFDIVRATVESEHQQMTVESSEAVSSCRLQIEDLEADCEYRLTVNYPAGEERLKFRTLPAPVGEQLAAYAVISDPHISSKHDNRKGRLFVESAQILQTVFQHCNELKLDFALIGGDLTNNAEQAEFEKLTDCLQLVEFPLICAPGDHDLKPDACLWNSYLQDYNNVNFSTELFNIKAINTSTSSLTATDARRLESMLDDPRIPVIVTHVHLLHNPNLKYGPKAAGITNYAEYKTLFERLEQRQSIIYAGHQNIPTQVQHGQLTQFNVPQTCQFPCSWYYVRAFANGLYHKNIPIPSEILRQQSRLDSERAADYFAEPHWRSEYRCGSSPAAGNFLLPLKLKDK